MKIRSQTFSALKALLDLAVHAGGSSPASLKEIAGRQGLSAGLLEQLFRDLKRAGLVEPWRGVRGGYRLARRPDRITLLDIFAALDEPSGRPPKPRGRRDPETEVLEAALENLHRSVEEPLRSISLSDLRQQLRDQGKSSSVPGNKARFSI